MKNNLKEFLINNLSLWGIACLSLGLAPFVPHPHIWKQLMNLFLGRTMLMMDWLDLLMHGMPFVLFLTALFLKFPIKIIYKK